MKELGIDIETYSGSDLTECGVYKYVEAEDFTILLLGIAWTVVRRNVWTLQAVKLCRRTSKQH